MDKRIISRTYELAVKAYDRLIIKHGYTFERLEEFRKNNGGNKIETWLAMINLYHKEEKRPKRFRHELDYIPELSKYYTEEQIKDTIKATLGWRPSDIKEKK